MEWIKPKTIPLSHVSDKDGSDCCRVTLPNGVVTPALDGKCLEACVAAGRDYILFITDNVPFEEQLHVYLIAESGRVLDSGTLGAWYTPALVSDIVLVPPDSIEFAFFGDDRWRVTLHATPKRFWLPWRRGSRVVTRPWQRARYFDLRCVMGLCVR